MPQKHMRSYKLTCFQNLNDPAIFVTSTLNNLRDLITKHSPDGIHTFSPLRSLRRIIIVFYSTETALEVRRLLDGETLFDNRIRVYFGEATPIEPPQDQHLQAPRLEKQFFISPPPSPPVGWEMRHEDPPNKEVHPDDLTSALERLSHRKIDVETASPTYADNRQRSGSVTIVYHPKDHGMSPDLPAIAVEDTTGRSGTISPIEEEPKKILAHTARPPVELMDES